MKKNQLSSCLARLIFFYSLIIIGGFACKTTRRDYASGETTLKTLFDITPGFDFKFQVTPYAPPDPGRIVTDILHPDLLKEFESNGYSFSELLSFAERGSRIKSAGNASLYKSSPWYASLANYIGSQIDTIGVVGQSHDVKRQDGEEGGERVYSYGTDDFSNIRLFQKDLMKSEAADYDLIGLVNRTDRMDFAKNADGTFANCGEVRFVYRMRYYFPKGSNLAGNSKGNIAINTYSRLPMTLNMVFEAKAPNGAATRQECLKAARMWLTPSDKKFASGSEVRLWLASQAAKVEDLGFKQLEVNVQAARLPSELRSELGGQAEYVLRILRPAAGMLAPVLLENTPDVGKIASNAQLKTKFANWIIANAAAIDNGTHKIPDEFLANQAKSVTTFGLHRRVNRPFTSIFSKAGDEDFAKFNAIKFADLKFMKQPQAVLARLDDSTCMGCHQGNAVAGFHLVGVDRSESTHPFNALRLAFSPHFMKEQKRRDSYSWQFAIDGGEPNTFRPLSFQQFNPTGPAPAAKVNERCFSSSVLNANLGAQYHWQCEAGLSCVDVYKNAEIGLNPSVCMRGTEDQLAGFGGDSCLLQNMAATSFYSPRADRLLTIGDRSSSDNNCAAKVGGGCLRSVGGAPGGLCTKKCSDSDRMQTGPGTSKEVCAYNGGSGFDSCAASDNWADCINDPSSTSRGTRAYCDEKNPCRDDFICQAMFKVDGGRKIIAQVEGKPGFCVPTYFIFQMRVDGHPVLGR